MSLELLIKQNALAIQQLINNSKDLSELTLYNYQLEPDDLLLFRIDALDQSVAVRYGDLLAQIQGFQGDKNYFHDQGTPSASWTIQHNMNKFPSVTVIDTGGNEVEGDVFYVDQNNLTINFNGQFSGTATLN